MQTKEEALEKLSRSSFRAGFHLTRRDRDYIAAKGLETIEDHARDFVRQRLAPAVIDNDGRQTPMRGHPVFLAQHACACCCRGCLDDGDSRGSGGQGSPVLSRRRTPDGIQRKIPWGRCI